MHTTGGKPELAKASENPRKSRSQANPPLHKGLSLQAGLNGACDTQEMELLDTEFLDDVLGNDPRAKTKLTKPEQPISTMRHSLLAVLFWVKAWSVPGMGMFCQGYFVFSISNLSAVFKEDRPACFKTFQECTAGLVQSQTYAQFGTIILGMLLLGYVVDQAGRRRAAIVTASIMFVGGLLLAASSGPTAIGFVVMFIISQIVFGFGVGGEYEVAASIACERAEANRVLRHRRGEMVIATFTMQGWGAVVSTLVLILFLLAVDSSANPNYDVAWRLTYVVGLLPLAYLIYFRLRHLTESKMWKKSHGKNFDAREVQLLWAHYWPRLTGAALAWFFWDVSFYGTRLFQSNFIWVMHPQAGLIEVLLWTLLSAVVPIFGYYAAAFVVDRQWMGRVRLQIVGFAMCFILYLMCSWGYEQLIQPENIKSFMFLFYFAAFWGQFGPNTTTFLLAAETVPTPVRGLAIGIAAATGKLGALLAAVLYHHITIKNAYFVSAFANLAGLLITLVFMPNLVGLSLREMDRRWKYLMQGKGSEYCGEALNPRCLSNWENLRGLGTGYSADRDARMKMNERKEAVIARVNHNIA
ncbi:hypothetical protein WJX72_004006 [[Myrmecia] bisecta]|uniref:Major facilitator superfamily (MFS) profile domain-containing protein n=1 Tax=[Myrmecia] bisecta TaxID=41462 RepID=A0AAW1P661_9CHLO